MLGGVLGEEEGRVEAYHAGLLDGLEGRVCEFERGEVVAGRVDDVVELGPAALREQLLNVGFDGGGGQVAWVAGDAALSARVRREESLDAGVDAGLLGRGDDDRGAEFEASFGDAVAYAGAAAHDEDAGAGELITVFPAVGHDGGCFCDDDDRCFSYKVNRLSCNYGSELTNDKGLNYRFQRSFVKL